MGGVFTRSISVGGGCVIGLGSTGDADILGIFRVAACVGVDWGKCLGTKPSTLQALHGGVCVTTRAGGIPGAILWLLMSLKPRLQLH